MQLRDRPKERADLKRKLETLITECQPHSRREVRSILDVLQNDGLLHKVEERFRFRSGLVRRYWKEYEAEWDAAQGTYRRLVAGGHPEKEDRTLRNTSHHSGHTCRHP